MRRSLLIAPLLLLLGCSSLFFRSGRDYFPLVNGSQWKYFDGQDTCYIEVDGDSTVGGQSCIIVSTDFVRGFWLKRAPETEIRRWNRNTLQRGGTEYVLEERYGLVYLLPLVEGNSWHEEYTDSIVILGVDTLRYRHRLEVRVAAVEPVTVPAGSFEDCYRLEFTETVVAEDSTTVNYTEWLAPDIGPVRRLSAGTEQVLAEYRIGP